MRSTMMDLLLVGVGWTHIAITLNRIAVGAFFMLSGYHKLFNAERLEFIDDGTVALCIEQLVKARQHEECPNCDPVQGHRNVGPPDTNEQQMRHGLSSRDRVAHPRA